uniref:Geranylgeranyl transferase type-2 subunit alpha n=1 Tax=Anas platyrhynchos platyrhynchos TaxID=8840 RepID=A0A493T8C3_ANAPP
MFGASKAILGRTGTYWEDFWVSGLYWDELGGHFGSLGLYWEALWASTPILGGPLGSLKPYCDVLGYTGRTFRSLKPYWSIMGGLLGLLHPYWDEFWASTSVFGGRFALYHPTGSPPAPPSSHQSILVRTGSAEGAPPAVHAWEHRRAEAGEAAEAELAFTAQLLARDFSNFSAWHHRGRLLADGPLPPERLRQELELVQNAVFTDPQDQSAWVYLRCLLARATPPPRLLSLHADLEDGTLAAAFSRPVLVSPGSLEASLEDRPLPGPWRPADGRPRPSCFWLCPLPPGLATPPARLRVAWQRGPAHFVTLRPGRRPHPLFKSSAPGVFAWLRPLLTPPHPTGETEAWWQEPIEARELIWPEVGVSDPAVLSELAQACRELLELEPRSRGCLLTLSLLLGALGPREHGEELRRCLRCLQVLDVSRNRVRSLRGLPPLPRLEELRLDGNPISHASDLAPLAACPRLARLRLVGTPLAAAPEAAAQLDKLLPHVAVALA